MLGLVEETIKAGGAPRTLLAATLLAGLHDLRPSPVGNDLHVNMMVASAMELGDRSSKVDSWLLAIWNADYYKRVKHDQWGLAQRPEVKKSSAAAARKEFHAAMNAWDALRVDRAVIELWRHHRDAGAMFEEIWPYGARCFHAIGHKPVYTSQIARALPAFNRRQQEAALRSLARGLVSGRMVKVYRRSRELVARLPDGWLRGKEQPSRSGEILLGLRSCDSKQAQDLVITAFREGIGPQTVWDGLRLYASELFHQRAHDQAPDRGAVVLPVHAVTEIEALGYAWRAATHDATKRLLVLQAAGWLPDHRVLFARRTGHDTSRPGLDVVARERGQIQIAAELARLTRSVAHRAAEAHQIKYAAALANEVRYVHPRWRPWLVAPAAIYLMAGAESESTRKAMAVLKRAGVS
ncbi:MAG: hypothetical protein CMJ18_06315 [Phycisphaeraceae bacterium]|nr:hypothetical protein [Phycisphaeraceae bacterium]